MNSSTKWYWIVGILVVIIAILAIVIPKNKTTSESSNYVVGAILPMTGPAALWGETFKNGMELALRNHPELQVIFQDSKSTAQDGISAFNVLKDRDVNLMVSELSLVSVPLAKVALDQKVPLFVSLVATNHQNIVNDFTTRYYTDPTNYALPAFTDPISPLISAKKIALLYRNDELGVSVKDKINELSKNNDKQIVAQESFMPNEKDYRTVLTKIKNSDSQVFIFVVANPIEATGIVKTASELGLKIPMIESSAVFADLDTRKQVQGIPFYSSSYDFSLPDKAIEFKKQYSEKFGKEPNFSSAFGYDIVNLIGACVKKNVDIKACLSTVNEFDGVAGVATQTAPSDFVVKLHLEKVNF